MHYRPDKCEVNTLADLFSVSLGLISSCCFFPSFLPYLKKKKKKCFPLTLKKGEKEREKVLRKSTMAILEQVYWPILSYRLSVGSCPAFASGVCSSRFKELHIPICSSNLDPWFPLPNHRGGRMLLSASPLLPQLEQLPALTAGFQLRRRPCLVNSLLKGRSPQFPALTLPVYVNHFDPNLKDFSYLPPCL